MLPQYDTILFTDVWDNEEDFASELAESPFDGAITSANVSVLFYLLYGRYGNNPIANRDITQWKFKMFSIIYQYGPTWEKRLAIQSELRALSGDDLFKGTKAVHNTALNPGTAPTTSSNDELTYINTQNVTNYKKSKMDAYAQLWELLDNDVTEDFLIKFRKCFKIFVAPERPLLYVTETEEISEGEDEND